MLASFPSQVDDATAKTFGESVRALGIEMQQARGKEHGPQSSVTGEPFKSVGDYDNIELKRVGASIERPPESVLEFLRAHAPEINRTSDLLISSEPPRWRMDTALGPNAPIPNLGGILNVQRVLVAWALIRAQDGDTAAAERALLASWRLNLSLRDRPEVISQWVAISAARMHAGLARRLPAIAAADWTARFQEHPYRASLLRAMVVEACGEYATLPGAASQEVQAMRVDFIDFKRRLLITLRDSPVGLDRGRALGRLKTFETDKPETFEFLASLSVPNWAYAWHKADLLTIDTELTAKILEARQWRVRSGHWPQQIPGVERSQLPGALWNYSVSPAGHMAIVFSGTPVWSDEQGLVLPLRFEAD